MPTSAGDLAWLAENATKEGVVVRPSGLQYIVLTAAPAGAKSPKPGTTCECHYRGTLLDGTQFDRSALVCSARRGQKCSRGPKSEVQHVCFKRYFSNHPALPITVHTIVERRQSLSLMTSSKAGLKRCSSWGKGTRGRWRTALIVEALLWRSATSELPTCLLLAMHCREHASPPSLHGWGPSDF